MRPRGLETWMHSCNSHNGGPFTAGPFWVSGLTFAKMRDHTGTKGPLLSWFISFNRLFSFINTSPNWDKRMSVSSCNFTSQGCLRRLTAMLCGNYLRLLSVRLSRMPVISSRPLAFTRAVSDVVHTAHRVAGCTVMPRHWAPPTKSRGVGMPLVGL